MKNHELNSSLLERTIYIIVHQPTVTVMTDAVSQKETVFRNQFAFWAVQYAPNLKQKYSDVSHMRDKKVFVRAAGKLLCVYTSHVTDPVRQNIQIIC